MFSRNFFTRFLLLVLLIGLSGCMTSGSFRRGGTLRFDSIRMGGDISSTIGTTHGVTGRD